MTTALRAIDLFCGAAGGWSLGIHRAGIETAAACEIDPWRRAKFSERWPAVRMYEDVRSLTATRLRHDLGYLPEIIVGSPPCQDASSANAKGKGVDGERTGLFFEALRLVREVRPVWLCLENVPGLKTRGYDRVHDELEAAGYAVWPLVVGAWHAGAPHRRNRVWIIAVAQSEQMGRAGFAWQEAQRAHDAGAALVQRHSIARDQSNGPDALDASDAEEISGRSGPDKSFAQLALGGWQDWNGGPPDLGRVDDGLPKGMARQMLSAFGDAVVPILPELIARTMLEAA